MTTFTTDDLPPVAGGCSHRHAVRAAVLDAVDTFWTTQPTVAERTITRLASLKNRIATAAGTSAANVSNLLVARIMVAYIEERFGGTD